MNRPSRSRAMTGSRFRLGGADISVCHGESYSSDRLLTVNGGQRSTPGRLRAFVFGGTDILVCHGRTYALGRFSPSLTFELLPTNLTIRRCPRLHAKTLTIDGQHMYLGSANLANAGLCARADGKRNFEMGIWTTSPHLIDPVLGQFNALWEGRQCRTCRRKDVCPVPL